MKKEKKKSDMKKACKTLEQIQTSMSITRALATIKRLSHELTTEETMGRLACLDDGDSVIFPIKGEIEEMKKIVNSNFTSFRDKYNELLRLKERVAYTNANTKAVFKGKEKSLYGWIIYKDTLNIYMNLLTKALYDIDAVNEFKYVRSAQETEERLKRRDELLKANRSLKEVDKIVPLEIQLNVNSFHKRDELVAMIEVVKAEKGEIDMLLSEYNAKTMIL